MNKSEYTLGIYAMKDIIKGQIVVIGHANNMSNYVRDTIPAINGNVPLNDIKVIEIGKLNPFTGRIMETIENPIEMDWKECYQFNFENKAENKE